jgi:hypothetical protein
MNMFKATYAKTPEEYINLIDDHQRQKDIKFLYDLIRKLAPKEKPNITSGMIGFGLYPYKTKSGREGEWPIIMLASQKNYISLYACAADGKEYIAEKYKKDFPKASIGRSCVRFKHIEDVDLKKLEELIIETLKTGFSFAQ